MVVKVKLKSSHFEAQKPVHEEIVIGGNDLEIISDDNYNVIVRIPYNTKYGLGSGKVLFSAPKENVLYAVHTQQFSF